jgi:hypothetical protein
VRAVRIVIDSGDGSGAALNFTPCEQVGERVSFGSGSVDGDGDMDALCAFLSLTLGEGGEPVVAFDGYFGFVTFFSIPAAPCCTSTTPTSATVPVWV